MSKVLVIPDVHLKPKMFKRATKILESGQADFAVQLGDMFDDWGEEYNLSLYARTAQEALKFYKKFPKTLWCMGNHDLGYYYPHLGVKESGHSMFAEMEMNTQLREFMKQGLKQEVVHKVDNVIFSHAGVTTDFLVQVTLDGTSPYFTDYDEQMVNDSFSEPELLWQECSPIWARPQEDHYTMACEGKYLQVVGHTPMKKVEMCGGVLSTDVFSTYHNGAPYGEQKFIIVDTKTKEWHYAEEE